MAEREKRARKSEKEGKTTLGQVQRKETAD